MGLIKSIFGLFLCCFATLVQASPQQYLDTIKTDHKALNAFFQAMPKGGELHYHLAGGAYPEEMLDLAKSGGYCLHPKTLAIARAEDTCNTLDSTNLKQNSPWYKRAIRAWSMKDFSSKEESGHDHFFASFAKFHPLVTDFQPQLLARIMERATKQNELYLEVMILPDDARSSRLSKLIKRLRNWSHKMHALLKHPQFRNNIEYTVRSSQSLLEKARQELHCDTFPQQKVCQITVKFQYFILREQPLDGVFAQALNGFAAAAESQDIVGINLVQPEDGRLSLKDYREQMQIMQFLNQRYPSVHIALHAGELSPSLVKAAHLQFHIHDAIFTGRAERIGHGVDILHETNHHALLKHMAKTPIPVEINLTSNEHILNISGEDHPISAYLAHDVPIVLSSDDEGILRTTLTEQYVTAFAQHHLDYATIKSINRNALTYSFLPGQSLWLNPKQGTPVEACAKLDSHRCKTFIKSSPKAQLQWQLEKQLIDFEKQY